MAIKSLRVTAIMLTHRRGKHGGLGKFTNGQIINGCALKKKGGVFIQQHK